jgi:hypothetical protein
VQNRRRAGAERSGAVQNRRFPRRTLAAAWRTHGCKVSGERIRQGDGTDGKQKIKKHDLKHNQWHLLILFKFDLVVI